MRSTEFAVVVFAASILLMASCSNKNEVAKIEGLWVSGDFRADSTFNSLTIIPINDSIHEIYGFVDGVVSVNALGVNPYDLAIVDTIPDRYEAHWPFDSYDVAFELHMSHDTLVQTGTYIDTTKYVRADPTLAYKYLLYNNSPLRLQIPEWKEGYKGINSERKSLLCFIYAGNLKTAMRSEYPLVNSDSAIFQVDDVLLQFEDLPLWISRQKDLLAEAERDSMRIMVVADKDVPDKFLKHLVQILEEHCNPTLIGRAYIDWPTRTVRYRKYDPSLF